MSVPGSDPPLPSSFASNPWLSSVLVSLCLGGCICLFFAFFSASVFICVYPWLKSVFPVRVFASAPSGRTRGSKSVLPVLIRVLPVRKDPSARTSRNSRLFSSVSIRGQIPLRICVFALDPSVAPMILIPLFFFPSSLPSFPWCKILSIPLIPSSKSASIRGLPSRSGLDISPILCHNHNGLRTQAGCAAVTRHFLPGHVL